MSTQDNASDNARDGVNLSVEAAISRIENSGGEEVFASLAERIRSFDEQLSESTRVDPALLREPVTF